MIVGKTKKRRHQRIFSNAVAGKEFHVQSRERSHLQPGFAVERHESVAVVCVGVEVSADSVHAADGVELFATHCIGKESHAGRKFVGELHIGSQAEFSAVVE